MINDEQFFNVNFYPSIIIEESKNIKKESKNIKKNIFSKIINVPLSEQPRGS